MFFGVFCHIIPFFNIKPNITSNMNKEKNKPTVNRGAFDEYRVSRKPETPGGVRGIIIRQLKSIESQQKKLETLLEWVPDNLPPEVCETIYLSFLK